MVPRCARCQGGEPGAYTCPGCLGKLAMTSAQRQRNLRAKRAKQGMAEVRGIYLPPELHADIKALARAMVEKLERARAKEQKT